jgi:hypothetical protein
MKVKTENAIVVTRAGGEVFQVEAGNSYKSYKDDIVINAFRNKISKFKTAKKTKKPKLEVL